MVMSDITPLRGEGRTVGRITGLYGELLSEFLGCVVLISFGDGVVAMAVAALPGSGRTAGPTVIFNAAGDWLLITWGWALAFAVRRKFAWSKVGPYMAAQVAGCFVGAALVFLVYHNAIDAFNLAAKTPKSGGGALATYSIFATFPASYFHGAMIWPLIDQIVGTMFLLMFVVAVIDVRNAAVQSNLAPLVIGLAVAAIGMSYGANAGYAINPARDFGPRLFAYFAGWGKVALPGSYNAPGFTFSSYFWVPIVGPLIGGVLGVLIYDLFIGDGLHARLKMVEEVSGPIQESRLPEESGTGAYPQTRVGGLRRPRGEAPPRASTHMNGIH